MTSGLHWKPVVSQIQIPNGRRRFFIRTLSEALQSRIPRSTPNPGARCTDTRGGLPKESVMGIRSGSPRKYARSEILRREPMGIQCGGAWGRLWRGPTHVQAHGGEIRRGERPAGPWKGALAFSGPGRGWGLESALAALLGLMASQRPRRFGKQIRPWQVKARRASRAAMFAKSIHDTSASGVGRGDYRWGETDLEEPHIIPLYPWVLILQ